MSDPYRTSAPKPPPEPKDKRLNWIYAAQATTDKPDRERPKLRVSWLLLVAHVALTIAWCYATSYLLWKGSAPWADVVNVSLATLSFLAIGPHAAIVASRETKR